MNFLLDESAAYPLAAHLRAQGHDVKAIAHDFPGAKKDTEVLRIAVAEQRVLITNDKDFGELVVPDGLAHAGVILFRLGDEDLPTKRQRLDQVLGQYADRLSELIVISERGVRIRRRAADETAVDEAT